MFTITKKPEDIVMPKYCRSCSELIPVAVTVCPKCGKTAGHKVQNEYWLMPYNLRLVLFLQYLYRYIRYKLSGKEYLEVKMPFPWLEVIILSVIVLLVIIGYCI